MSNISRPISPLLNVAYDPSSEFELPNCVYINADEMQEGHYLTHRDFYQAPPNYRTEFPFTLEEVPDSTDYIIVPINMTSAVTLHAGMHPQNREESMAHDSLHWTACRNRGCFAHQSLKSNARWCRDDYRINYCPSCGYTNHTTTQDCQWTQDTAKAREIVQAVTKAADLKCRATYETIQQVRLHYKEMKDAAETLQRIRTAAEEEPEELCQEVSDDSPPYSPTTPTSESSLVLYDKPPKKTVYFATTEDEPEVIAANTYADIEGKDDNLTHVITTYLDEDWDAEIRKAYEANDYPRQYPTRKFKKADGLLFEYVNLPFHQTPQLRTFIPDVQKNGVTLRESIIARTHSVLGHPQASTTAHEIRDHFTWPTLIADVTKFCQTCDVCQRAKDTTQRPPGLAHPLPVPAQPWTHISMDFMKLPDCEVDGAVFNQLFVIVDRFSKYTYLIPQNVWYDTEDVARDFYEKVYVNEGLPLEIISDRDTKFTSKFWQCMLQFLQIKPAMSTAFHPTTDGQTEKRNKDTLQVLRAFLIERGEKWFNVIKDAQAALNFRVDTTTGKSPFEICRGYPPRIMPFPKKWELTVPAVTNTFFPHALYYGVLQEKLAAARDAQSHQTNKNRRMAPAFEVGNEVMLSTKNIKPDTEEGKLLPRWIGPFPITEVHPDTDNYRLQLPPRYSKLHDKFHVSLLKPYRPNDDLMFPGRRLARPAAVEIPEVEADNLFLVDHIRERKISRNGKKQYLIRWKGYGPSDDSWEPIDNIPEQLTDAYDRANPISRRKRQNKSRAPKPKKR